MEFRLLLVIYQVDKGGKVDQYDYDPEVAAREYEALDSLFGDILSEGEKDKRHSALPSDMLEDNLEF